MSGRVLILTAGFGEGHNAAARSLAAAFDALQGAGTARVADVFALAAPRGNALARRSYLGLINRAPWLWRAAYGWMHRSALLPGLLRSLRRERRVLAGLLATERPVAVCSTYPVYSYLLQALARERAPGVPCFNVVTDSISINSLWWRAGADGWFVPNDESAAVMREAGVDERRLRWPGFPFRRSSRRTRASWRRPTSQKGRRRASSTSSTPGPRAAEDTARLLLQETTWDVTCTVGRNQRLQRELEELASFRCADTRILGWTEEIPRLLMTHHVVISKAGGATTQEALAARCPMIVNQIVPGQEEGNYELLRRHGIGALATTRRGGQVGVGAAPLCAGPRLEALARSRRAVVAAAGGVRHRHGRARPQRFVSRPAEPIPLPFRAAAASA
jgi:processive 1,2-diacylglycerol beta-glucosyltransferase